MTPRGGRLTPGTEADARKHWRKGLEFAAAAHLELNSDHPTPAYSNAILSVIHAADALCIHYAGSRSSGQDHLEAVALIEALTEFPDAARDAFLDHFRSLSGVKSRVQYSGDQVEWADAATAIKHMERALEAVKPLAKVFGSN